MEQLLAAANTAETAGRVVGFLFFPALGLVLLIIGVVRRSASNRPSPVQHPHGGPIPAGFPPPRPRRSGTALIVIGALVLTLGLFGGCASLLLSAADSVSARTSAASSPTAERPPTSLTVGECISYTDYAAGNLTADAIDCGDADAVFQLVYVGDAGDACPDGQRNEQSRYGLIFNSSQVQCFIPNLDVGNCYSIDIEAKMFVPQPCSSPDADTMISAIVDDTEDVAVCGQGVRGVSFPEPQRVFCVVPPTS